MEHFGLRVAIALAAVCQVLGQAQVPGYIDMPLSATISDVLGKADPTGRAALLARLGNPPQYFGSYEYPWPDGEFAIDPEIDPALVNPLEGNDSPANGSFKVVGNSGMISVHVIPYPNGKFLFYGRPAEPYGGGDPGGPGLSYLRVAGDANEEFTEIAAIYDTKTNTFEPFHIPDAPFCGAQTILPDGRGFIMGGEHVNTWYPYLQYGGVALRIMDPDTLTIKTVHNFQRGRWYPSVMTMADGKILCMGGAQQEVGAWGTTVTPTSVSGQYEKMLLETACLQNGGPGDPYWDNPSFEIYDPVANTLTPALALTILLDAYPINLYPYLWTLPTGSTLIMAGVHLGAMYLTSEGATKDELVGDIPDLKIPIGPFQYTAATMLTLEPPTYSAQILIAGGTADYCPNQYSLGNNESYLIDVTPGANHSRITESLAYGRVMGDLTVLPDGRALLCNGAQIGVGGGGGPRYSNAAKPSTVLEIYDPKLPIGQRWKTLGDSQIPRLYHSIAILTDTAELMISGSETTSERRVQIYTPDYLTNGKPRPVITKAPTTLTYGGKFDTSFSGVSAIERVVLSRRDSNTHGIHFDQRQVLLDCDPSATRSVSCTAPPNSSVAVPGIYMLFILSEGVPSVATYVSFPVPVDNTPPPPYLRQGYSNGPAGTVTAPESAPLSSVGAQAPNIWGPELGTDAHKLHDQKPAAYINPNGETGLGAGPPVESSSVEGPSPIKVANVASDTNSGASSSGGSATGGGSGTAGR